MVFCEQCQSRLTPNGNCAVCGEWAGELLCPKESINCTLAFATKDWGMDKSDAWIYGIVAGWDEDSLDELKLKFRWTTRTVERLKALHKAWEDLRA